MTQIAGNQVMIVFNSHSASRRTVVGPATKTNYGYRKQGDTFKVFESDMRVRPDLFRPVAKEKKQPELRPKPKPRPVSPVIAKAETTISRAAPQPPPPPTLLEDEGEPFEDPALADMEWNKVNGRHILILSAANIVTIGDVHRVAEEQLLAITGIGPVIAKELKEKGKEYPLVL